jgi:hypothetical protein
VALNKASTSSTSRSNSYIDWVAVSCTEGQAYGPARYGNDGDVCSFSHTFCDVGCGPEWWQVDLGSSFSATSVVLYNRLDQAQDRLNGATVAFLNENGVQVYSATVPATSPLSVTINFCSTCAAAAGYFCPTDWSATTFLPCPAGSFCTGGSTAPQTCPAGAYSPAGASSCAYTASACPVGTYAAAPASCVACSPATACSVVGLSAQPPCYWRVSTLAGSGALGWADGQGEAAVFNYPTGVAVDPVSLNVFVGDWGGNRVRRITPSGTVTTFAGSGSNAFANGVGTAASFSELHGVPVDLTGNVYVAAYGNHRIRKILPSGVVSTLAGSGIAGRNDGIGTTAQLNGPTDIAIESRGKMGYIVDQGGNKIRSIMLSIAYVSTLAGSGVAGFADGTGTVAQFSGPTSAAWHSSGILFIAGNGDHSIRRIVIASAVVST